MRETCDKNGRKERGTRTITFSVSPDIPDYQRYRGENAGACRRNQSSYEDRYKSQSMLILHNSLNIFQQFLHDCVNPYCR